MITLLCAVLGYLIGSLSFAIVASRMFGLPDPRSYGSGNPGATNVLRSGRRAAAAVTLIGDLLKGLVAVLIASYVAFDKHAGELPIAAAGVAAFLGHLYPLYFGFKGGKGVATALGVLLGLNALVALFAVGVFLAVAVVSRYVSLASIAAALVGLIAALIWLGWELAGAVAIIAILIIWRHRANLKRLMAGTESRLQLGKKPVADADVGSERKSL